MTENGEKNCEMNSEKTSLDQPLCLVIAGPNGAGKSTFAKQYLYSERGIDYCINADLIASGISPARPEMAALSAGRIFLQEFDRLSTFRESFAIETTLSGLVYINRFKLLKAKSYRLEIIYLDLKDSGLAVKRVKARVREGGHGISPKEIRRRFFRSRENFLNHYIHLADAWHHYDNSGREPILINKSW